MAGKKRKQSLPTSQKIKQHRVPLDADNASIVSKKPVRPPKQQQSGEKMISSDLSSKILKEALNQQKEILREEQAEQNGVAFSDGVDSDSDGRRDDEDYDFEGFSETIGVQDLGVEGIDEEDEETLKAFFGSDLGPQPTLADLIIKKIKEKDVQGSSEIQPLPKFDDDVIEAYKNLGSILSRYTSGKLPKALHQIAQLECWEEILCITEPEKWSPNAMFQATRIFSSRFNPNKARRFYKLVLLPHVRKEIQKSKRLHRALYEALKKSLYKPAGFFKGILFPLCESKTCTLIEAHIIGSIILKVSIPPFHSSVALLTLANMDYYGTTSYFMKLLIEKKYALPYRVLDAIVAHFLRFLEDKRVMPVIWHQTLLAFVQRYKHELTKEDKDNLNRLMQHQKHYLV
ncbi:hypothetical protein HPP92_001329 [Vanilla planifolia]|uniref:Bystin n=1 Tax=Vanilla planifolia TaxID=51239 RepID=A0A835SCQ9_VANPL|nr:hypothetical protein HPP92_001329 [Vanilla planifolia]